MENWIRVGIFILGYLIGTWWEHTKYMYMKFIAEILELKQRKTVDLEKEFTIKLRTTDEQVMWLSKIAPDKNVIVTIEEE